MGFYYRKTIIKGPFRINLSKSGVGFSVGRPGFRISRTAKGRTYTTFGVPGTGFGYRGKTGFGCLVLLAPALLLGGTLARLLW